MNKIYHIYGIIPVYEDIVNGGDEEVKQVVKEYMENLINKMKEADEAYFNGEEIISNKEYDDMYYELKTLEEKSGIILPNSPSSMKVGVSESNELKKVVHESPMLSLDKTKDMSELCNFFKDIPSTKSNNVIVMWKMDGSTVVATYDNGTLTKLVTRGNGEIGSDITHNAKYIKGLPLNISYKGHLVVRGEVVMSYEEFDRINSLLPDDEKYKNPRNLATATMQLIDDSEISKRELFFFAFKLVNWKDVDFNINKDSLYAHLLLGKYSFYVHLLWLDIQGFSIVENIAADPNSDPLTDYSALENEIVRFSNRVDKFLFPVDGLVIAACDVSYAESLPGTGHNPNKMVGYAFKWADETVETTLRDIEWSASRTGLLNPVAVFDPVELEGTTVTRASLHNVAYILEKRSKIGDKITVYKANKIIPQIDKNMDQVNHYQTKVITSDLIKRHSLPVKCPICEGEVDFIFTDNDCKTVIAKCKNDSCAAKQVKKFVHFCERDCMNIRGLSEETISKFVEKGFIKSYRDIYRLETYKDEIVKMDGFGEKAYSNIIAAVEKSRNTDFISFIHACGIPNVGKGQAKLLRSYLDTRMNDYLSECEDSDGSYDLMGCLAWLVWSGVNGFDFTRINGFGSVISDSLNKWVDNELVDFYCRYVDTEVSDVLSCLKFTDKPLGNKDSAIAGKTFVITGSLVNFTNRDELVSKIESLGGKVSGSVSKNTDYLINNDVESTSGKNKKAKDLGIPVISEEEFMKLIKKEE